MPVDRFSLDTNLLVYAVDRDAGTRHQKAAGILDAAVDRDCVLALQVLGEFFHTVTRKGKMPLDQAAAQVSDWQLLFPVVVPQVDTLACAIRAVTEHNLSFWDAMLWATVNAAGITILLTEDFQDGRTLGGVRFRNPFSMDDAFMGG